jgi:hypothetical protein
LKVVESLAMEVSSTEVVLAPAERSWHLLTAIRHRTGPLAAAIETRRRTGSASGLAD